MAAKHLNVGWLPVSTVDDWVEAALMAPNHARWLHPHQSTHLGRQFFVDGIQRVFQATA